MSPSPARRNRLATTLASVAVVAVLLGGCTGQTKPKKYGDGVEEAFVKGCTKTLTADQKDAETKLGDPAEVCKCAYEKISDEKDGVDFGRVRDVDDDLSENPGKLPDDIAKVVASCK